MPHLYRRYDQVVETMLTDAAGLIQVPTQDEHVGAVCDHLNFRLLDFSEEENLKFQVCRVTIR